MDLLLRRGIKEEAQKLVCRHQEYAFRLHETFERVKRRGLTPPSKVVHQPQYWAVDSGFNPYLVRARADRIGASVARAIRSGNYVPRPAVEYSVPKGDGTTRLVSVFQVADNAVSRIIYKGLLAKNARQLSSYCYAYREDRSAQDAISHLSAELRDHPRLFVAEFDFSRFFDMISHEHIARMLRDQRFFITKRERSIVDAFLRAPTSSISQYPGQGEARERGIPQGTSISLFLANVAGYPLDRRLERLGVGFARYADDTVIWSPDYASICSAADALHEAAERMGVSLNFEKSAGISLISRHSASGEIRSKRHISFLGYRVGHTGSGLSDATVKRAKERIAQIVFTCLLEGPAKGVVPRGQLTPPLDRDYSTMILQLRRFIYGGLTERELALAMVRVRPRVHFKGLMSYFPLVDDEGQLRGLDGWLEHLVWTSLQKRSRLLQSLGHTYTVPPAGVDRTTFRTLRVPDGAKQIDLALPSFSRIACVLRRAAQQYGPNAIANPNAGAYYLA